MSKSTTLKRTRRNWVATRENEQIVVSRADGFLSIDTAEHERGKWRSNESIAVAWELVPSLISALTAALAAHDVAEGVSEKPASPSPPYAPCPECGGRRGTHYAACSGHPDRREA
jgi:hypothetical protein